ncbi:hypothetical protein ACLK1G_20110 [Pseudomonas sp. NR3]|uniref:hypothetical protein n=1 Tax=Pseudomonas sp. NR3 TaxID=3155978 RepID=UPI003B67C474
MLAKEDIEYAGLIASKLAPTFDLQRRSSHLHRKPIVGASLLAIAVSRPVEMLNMPALSRAGSLPHLIFNAAAVMYTATPLWGGFAGKTEFAPNKKPRFLSEAGLFVYQAN